MSVQPHVVYLDPHQLLNPSGAHGGTTDCNCVQLCRIKVTENNIGQLSKYKFVYEKKHNNSCQVYKYTLDLSCDML